MLGKRTRSHQKDQMVSGSDSNPQSDLLGRYNHKNNSFFSIPGLFVGLSNKALSDYESVWSPTSPLDFRMFSNIGNPFAKSPRPPQKEHQKGWGSGKVGLSIVDSLSDDVNLSGKTMRSSESKNILFGPGMRIKNPRCQNHVGPYQEPKSLPKDHLIFPPTLIKTPLRKENPDVVFEIGENTLEPRRVGKTRSCSVDSCSSLPAHSGLADCKTRLSLGDISRKNITMSPVSRPHELIGEDPNLNSYCLKPSVVSLGSTNGFSESISPNAIELFEDYTCVISHGPKPKITHIYGDCVLECLDKSAYGGYHVNEEKRIGKAETMYPSDFLSFCHFCNKKLEDGKDIYIYRGEKAFCSFECRSQEIQNDEEMEEAKSPKHSHRSVDGQEPLENGVVFTT